MSLLLAIPGTIIYKVLYDGNAPYTSAQVTEYTNAAWAFPSIESEAGAIGIAPPPLDGWTDLGFFIGMFVYSAIDTAGDSYALEDGPPSGMATFLSVVDLALTTAILAFGAPWTQFSDTSGWNYADELYVCLWGAAVGILLTNLAFFVHGLSEAKFFTGLGPFLIGGLGLCTLALAVAFTVVDNDPGPPRYSWLYYAGAILGAIPSAMKIVYPALSGPDISTAP